MRVLVLGLGLLFLVVVGGLYAAGIHPCTPIDTGVGAVCNTNYEKIGALALAILGVILLIVGLIAPAPRLPPETPPEEKK